MAEVTLTWLKGKQFVGTDSTNHSIVLSSAEEGVGMKPSELLLVALAGCTGYDVVNILTKKRTQLIDVEIKVSAKQAPEPPWRFESFHIHYKLTGLGLNPKDVEKAIELSEEKYCSVSNTLRRAATITWDYEVVEMGEPVGV